MTQPSPTASRITGAAAALLAALAAASVAPPAQAEAGQVRTVASTGLFTLHGGHTVHLHLIDLGDRRAEATTAVLKLVDGQNRVVKRLRATLRPGKPLRLTMPGPDSGPLVVRAEAVLLTGDTNLTTAPMLTVEVVNDATLDAFTTESCLVPFDPEGTGGRVLGDCGGCFVLVELGR